MLLIRPVQEVGRGLFPLIAVLITGITDPVRLTISAVGAALLLAAGVVRYFTTAYRITPHQVQIRRGLFTRKLTTTPLERVRTVDVTSPFLHRILGLGRVVIGTGRTDTKRQHDLVLDGLTGPEAAVLRTQLLRRLPEVGAEVTAVNSRDVELVRLRLRWISYAPFTLSGAVTALVIIGFGWRVVNEARLDPTRFSLTRDAISSLRRSPWWLDVIQVLVVVVVSVTVLSVTGYVLAFYGFHLTRRPDGTLHVERGLVTRRQTTLEHKRVRGVEVSEPLLLRAVGGARLIAIATGLRVGRGAERGGTMLVPPSPRRVTIDVGATIIGSTSALVAPLRRHGPVASRRRYTRALIPAAVAIAALIGLSSADVLPGWVGPTSIALLLPATLLAADRADALGHWIGGPLVVTRYGSLVRRRSAFAAEGVIGATVRASIFQRRAGVCTVNLTTAAGRQAYPITDLPTTAAWDVVHEVLPAVRVP